MKQLAKMPRETSFATRLASRGIQPPRAALALEVLSFLMVNENLQVIEIAFAVVAPWSCDEVLNLGILSSLLLSHVGVMLLCPVVGAKERAAAR
jgi:hypothetical protein